MPGQKRRKFSSVKSRIERIAGLKKGEIALTKKCPGGTLRRVKIGKSTKASFEFDMTKLPKSHFLIHTHLPYKRATAGKTLVSIEDILALSNTMEAGKTKTGVITSLNKKSEVVGYTAFKIDGLFPPESEIIEKWKQKLKRFQKNGQLSKRNRSAYHQLLKEHLKEFGVNLRVHLVKMPGYYFNKKTSRFLRIRKNNPQ